MADPTGSGSNGGTTTVVSNPPNPPTINTVPNTTTNTEIVEYQTSVSESVFDPRQNPTESVFDPEQTTTLANATSARDVGVSPQSDPSQFPAYDDNGNLQPGFAINEETGDTYYRGQGPLTRDVGVSPQSDPSQFPAYDDNGNLQPGFAINEETGDTYYRGQGPLTKQTAGFDPNYDEFGAYDAAVAAQRVDSTSPNSVYDPYYGYSSYQLSELSVLNVQSTTGADPTDPYIRARLGLPQLPGSTLYATGGLGTIKTGVPAIDSALGIIGGLTSSFFNGIGSIANSIGGLFGPTPTASAAAATTGSGVAGLTQLVTGPTTKDTAVNPASDPSQFPAYDDNGNLQPGFAINEETGETYYRGLGPTTKDTAVSPASDPSQFPAYDDNGNLQPGFAINEETGETYYRGVGPGIKDTAVNPASDPSQFPAYDDNGNLQPGFKVNDETGQPYFAGYAGNANNASESVFDTRQDPGENVFDPGQTYNGPAASESVFDPGQDVGENVFDPGQTFNTNGESVFDPADVDTGETMSVAGLTAKGVDTTTLNADQADAFYNGTGTPTAAQQAATNAQTAADAAALYPGTNNTNLKEINAASAAIAQNEAGITNAQNIIDQNNAELADPNISDARRAELEANNAAQENYIRLAESNTAENELVIEANADAFAAGGGEPGSGQGPTEVAALEDPGLDPVVEEVGPLTEADVPVDALTDEELAVQEAYQQDQRDALVESESPTEISAEEDPFEASRLEAEQELNRQQLTEEATDVEPGLFTGQTDEFGGVDEAVAQQQQDVDNQNDPGLSQEQTDAEFERLRTEDQETNDVDPGPGYVSDSEAIAAQERAAVNEAQDQDPGPGYVSDSEAIAAQGRGGLAEAQESQFQGSQEAAIRNRAKQQATFQARYKQQGNQDWRVRLSLSPNAQYLYNAGTPKGSGAGILAPLAKTDGVIFPYTPSITTTYSANYEQYDLTHSNYRGIFYKNSRVGDIQVRGTFTAQDSAEANYLLAVIHFFRSATKMFYGQDAERGTPPPVCLLNGLGQYQFSDHPVVISSFNYTTPNDVDYIRATNPNNYGDNLLNRRSAVASSPGGQSLAGLNRLLNALPGGLPKGAIPQVPSPGMVQQSVSNTAGATYVPTKMEIDITLIPVQTRSQVSKQFSLKGFANGDLLKGGFW